MIVQFLRMHDRFVKFLGHLFSFIHLSVHSFIGEDLPRFAFFCFLLVSVVFLRVFVLSIFVRFSAHLRVAQVQ